MIEFNYVCKKTGEIRQGVVWDNGYVGSDSGARYRCPKDFSIGEVRPGSVKLPGMARSKSEVVWRILELQPLAEDGRKTFPRLISEVLQGESYFAFVDGMGGGVSFCDPRNDVAPWIGGLDDYGFVDPVEMSHDDWCKRVVMRCEDVKRGV